MVLCCGQKQRARTTVTRSEKQSRLVILVQERPCTQGDFVSRHWSLKQWDCNGKVAATHVTFHFLVFLPYPRRTESSLFCLPPTAAATDINHISLEHHDCEMEGSFLVSSDVSLLHILLKRSYDRRIAKNNTQFSTWCVGANVFTSDVCPADVREDFEQAMSSFKYPRAWKGGINAEVRNVIDSSPNSHPYAIGNGTLGRSPIHPQFSCCILDTHRNYTS
jgi:hypothetical protein